MRSQNRAEDLPTKTSRAAHKALTMVMTRPLASMTQSMYRTLLVMNRPKLSSWALHSEHDSHLWSHGGFSFKSFLAIKQYVHAVCSSFLHFHITYYCLGIGSSYGTLPVIFYPLSFSLVGFLVAAGGLLL